ncbi:MAG: c-type cytochrome [Bryobacteraceae bacterium]|nr:c-type cytochrome [Bryobacteraceae bacterium]
MILAIALLALAADLPDQAIRGKELFNLKSATGYACTTCHAVAGEGTAVGPDLKTIAPLHPRAVVLGILATRTQYVKTVSQTKTKSFPMIQSGDIYYDLSKNPPAAVKLTPDEIQKARDNGSWKHPPESRGLTKEQLADLIAYLRFALAGDAKGVDAKELN